MDVTRKNTWIIFYLISFVVLLWTLFLTTQGMLLGVGLTLVIVVVGLNVCILSSEFRQLARRRERMKALSPDR